MGNFIFGAALATVALIAAMLVAHEAGRWTHLRQAARAPNADLGGAGIVEGAIFALIGLLLAFAFSGAASRFDERRQLIVQEANAIGTAYLRLELLPSPAREELRTQMRDYLDTRLRAYRALPDLDAARGELAKAERMQQQIWSRAVAAANGIQAATMLLLPALNDVFDIATSRTMSSQTHVSGVIFGLLVVMCLLGAFFAGYSMAKSRRDWVHVSAFALTLSAVVYVIIDLEFPRFGLIRVDDFDQLLSTLLQGMR
jgi:hypothetical protein